MEIPKESALKERVLQAAIAAQAAQQAQFELLVLMRHEIRVCATPHVDQ